MKYNIANLHRSTISEILEPKWHQLCLHGVPTSPTKTKQSGESSQQPFWVVSAGVENVLGRPRRGLGREQCPSSRAAKSNRVVLMECEML